MGKLYLVPTPIGNLGDISLRALEVLRRVDHVLAEDSRKTGILLKHYEISKPLESHHKFNEHKRIDSLVARLTGDLEIALVSDAGTPGISDPGFLLVRACLEAEIEIETLPGATAFVPALVNSGLPCERFVFEGFLPQKKGRKKRLESLAGELRTMVFYESPYRLLKTLDQMALHFGAGRRASISRELSKIHEETRRGSLGELKAYYEKAGVKGELVLVVEGAGKT
ncbi:MAG: 16S rRNA (cytidine(1402)-2'-O)-methyltransferase [Bacteroidetes bacterium]|nr:MAG: 16S rRNA (cytidine(1402)-2'-O)-methyltransferase [Bacteroidota bacterium]